MTKILYIDETWNPITGCQGRGCKARCWAKEMVRRLPVIHDPEYLESPGAGFAWLLGEIRDRDLSIALAGVDEKEKT